ncbi:Uncharacterised protein [Mycobacteroides abscessus subsp. massiliense]|nr:Uncharacterised protein [Mycobacteroides abscessus subsp. massiliense]SKH39157.1 Uncharacterised protein [Mycobacteroides abscessus subsp. massiliense]SKI31369.1 Uncharacterised protein [Mycobacteroides abscessus subsp. massiliense]SKJ17371.1 Uncharacterised protein [Mycobacteroides abscessus subsp. massiliense]SKJ90512.1 Uncharacterised protein [Mycobacteroides abscessus subsp. massiliense]
MRNVLPAAVGVLLSAAVMGLGAAPVAGADPAPPPVCYATKPSATATDWAPCLAPGAVQYQQGAHQPTYGGANPLVPYGTNPLVPYGTNQNNAG